jgi:putative methyltransferase (TIGR04325 family)
MRLFRTLRDRVHWRGRTLNGCRGLFRDFEEAAASVPRGRAIGYDNAEAASLYRQVLDRPRHEDYPALFWLDRAFRNSRTVFEIGGHVGVAYYAFERFLSHPEGLEWTILDTKAVAEAGKQLARERGRHNLRFVTDFAEVKAGVDILFAAGSLQYLPGPLLPERVRAIAPAPRHILINNTPVTDRDGFVTLQDIALSYCPYRIHSRAELITPLLSMGYELVDSWQKERRLVVPGHPQRTLEHYSGFYLTRPG